MSVVNALEEVLAARLDELGLAVRRPRASNRGTDLSVQLPAVDGPLTAFIEVRSSESPVSSTRYTAQLDDRAPHLIIGQRHIPDGLGRRYRASGVNYIDSGGNAWISAPGYLVHIEGRKPALARTPDSERRSRALRPAGLQVVFALLVRPDLVAAPLRQVAAASEVSLGTTQHAIADLTSQGFVYQSAGRRALTNVPRLTELWVTRFDTDLRPKLAEANLEGPAPAWWLSGLGSADWDAAIGGETAMAAMKYPIRPETTTIYGRPPWQSVRRSARLKRGDAPNVNLRQKFWSSDHLGEDALVPSLLVYADALASNDPRQIEIAQEMRQGDAELRRLYTGT